MLDKRLCKALNIDPVEEFFVNYIDELDDQLEMENSPAKRVVLLRKKAIINKLREYYIDLQRN